MCAWLILLTIEAIQFTGFGRTCIATLVLFLSVIYPRSLVPMDALNQLCVRDYSGHHASVVVINRPLEGGVAAPAGTEEMTRKDVNVFIAMLRSFPENQVGTDDGHRSHAR